MTSLASVASRLPRSFVFSLAAASLFAAAPALAQQAVKKPSLDVPYVPTPPEVVARMLEMAEVGPNDYVIDLGSGDGRIAIAAAKVRGARAFGVDIDPERIQEAQANAKAAGVDNKVQFRQQDLFKTPIGEASVLTMYLLSQINIDLRPRILDEMKPGSRVVSHAFDMDDWNPDQRDSVNGRSVFLWIVPAKVHGRWRMQDAERAVTLTFNQEFQRIAGTAEINGRTVPLREARLNGAEITFIIDGENGGKPYRGRVEGGSIAPLEGGAWRATRAS